MYAKRTTKRSAAKKPRRRVPRKSGGGRKAITKIVKSIISRQAENKSYFKYAANNTISTASASVPTNVYLLPTCAQGTGKSDRIGNEIRIKSGYIRGHVNILPYDGLANPGPVPIYVKMWLISSKVINTNTLSSTVISTDFFDIVNGAVGFQGNMLDMNFTVNKDLFVVHQQKMVKLGAASATSTGPVGLVGYFDNSPMSVPFTFNFGKYFKTIKYDDTANLPTNKNLFLIFTAVQANGTSSTNLAAEYHYVSRVEYEDM